MTKQILQLGPGLDLPLHFATEGVVCTGVRGSGKSNTLVRWAEVLDEARIPFVAIDPKGDWWGIRSSADGKSPGMSVPIFGGRHADFPLTEHLGADLANLLVDQNMSAVIDISVLTAVGRQRFLQAFCDTLFERHKAEPHVRCVLLEEAHKYVPQQMPSGDGGQAAKTKESVATLLLEGRSFGLGCWAVTQRPARLNKDLLEEIDTAFIHRVGVTATNDLKTIKGWLQHEAIADDVYPTLTSLKAGEAWLLSPAQLGVVQRVRVDRRRTFDSGATPLVGAGSRPSVTLAQIDTAAVTAQLAEAIEKAKEADPRHLTARIRHLEGELDWWHKLQMSIGPDFPLPKVGSAILGRRYALIEEHDLHAIRAEAVAEEVPVAYVPQGAVDAAQVLADAASDAAVAAQRVDQSADAYLKVLKRYADDMPSPPVLPEKPAASKSIAPPPVKRTAPPTSPRPATPAEPNPGVSVPKGERAVLIALVSHLDRGCTREHLTLLTGYKKSTRNAYLLRLSGSGFVEDRGGRFYATEAGIEALGDSYEPQPVGDALLEHYLAKLPAGEAATLRALAHAYPDGMEREDIQTTTGYKKSTSNAYILRLSTRELVSVAGSVVTADGMLFD